MALVLDGSTQYLYNSSWSPHGGAYPFSVSGWFYTTDMAQSASLVSIDNNNPAGPVNLCQFFGPGTSPDDPLRVGTYLGAWGIVATTTGATTGTWHHFTAVWASATDRRIFIDGGSKGTNTDSRNGGGTYNVCIGCRYGVPSGAAVDLLFDGKLAHIGIWTSALSDANAASLAGGALPTAVDASNLEDYWALISDSNSDGGNTGSTLTEVGTPSFDAADPISAPSYIELASTGELVCAGTADLDIIAAMDLEASGAITFAGTAALTKKVIVDGLNDTTRSLLVGFGNDGLWFEDI